MVGKISNSGNLGHLVCEILDYEPFATVVGLKGADGYYYEADPERGKLSIYWSQGVRPIRDDSFDCVVAAGLPMQQELVRSRARGKGGRGGFPPNEVIVAVDRYAVRAALAEATKRFPDASVTEMPHNNPGFDIRVGPSGDEMRFIEVKGTQLAEPWFFMSEGERQFSIAQDRRYSVVLVAGIDLANEQHESLLWRDGNIDQHVAEMEPVKWSGRLAI